MTARTDPENYYDRDLHELHRWEQAMSNASDSTPKAQPLTGAEAQVNWDLLRRSVERDLASARAASKRTGDFSDHRAYAYQLVLDSMDVFEFGLAYWRAKTQAERDAQAAPGTEFRDCSCGQRVYLAQRGWYHWIDGSPVSACAPGLAEHTQAAAVSADCLAGYQTAMQDAHPGETICADCGHWPSDFSAATERTDGCDRSCGCHIVSDLLPSATQAACDTITKASKGTRGKRIVLTEEMRAEAESRLAGCSYCGDDLGIHEWIQISEADGEIINCDRSDTITKAAQ